MNNHLLKTLFLSIACILLAAPVFSEEIDNMDSIVNWSTSKDGNATISIQSVIGYQSNALKATYDLTNGNYVTFGRSGLGNGNFSGGDSISITYRGAGDSNNLELKMIDSDGDIFVAVLSNATNTGDAWVTSVIPQSSFGMWTDSDGNAFGNGTRNWANIVKYDIGIAKKTGGEGYVEVDSINAYQQNLPGTFVLDACETGTNSLGNTVSAFADSAFANSVGLTIENTDPSPKGGKYYKSTYSMVGGWLVAAGEDLRVLTSSYNASAFGYINFYMKVGTLNEKPKIELWFYKPGTGGTTGAKVLDLTNYGSLSTGWKFYSVPLNDFNLGIEGSSTTCLTELKIVTDVSAGVLYFDNFFFSDSPNESTVSGDKGILNGFEDSVNNLTYPVYTDKDAVMAASSVNGVTGKAIRFDYKFNKGEWMVCDRGTGLNAAISKGFRFKYKGTGVASNLEFKVKDSNNVEFFKKFFNFTNTFGEWKTATILPKDFTLFAKGKDNNDALDLKNIAGVSFAVTKTGNGGQGTFYVDNMETISEQDFQQIRPGKIIDCVSIDNNPFSPNGDGIEDYATISYNLSDYAHVWLDIYNMAGEVVRRIDVGDQDPAAYSNLQWDGKNDDGGTVNNGPYFYRLTAKNPDNQSDVIKQLIMVIK